LKRKSMNTPTPARALRVGLIGAGGIADQRLIPALSRLPGAIFWSVLGRDKSRTEAFALRHQAGAPSGQTAFTDLATFLADPALDAVIIASPDRLHAEQAIACAAAGKHIFVEKPLATSNVDADRVAAAVEAAGVCLAVGYHLRFHAGHKIVAEMIADKRLGRLQHMHVNWAFQSSPADWRNSAASGRWWSLAAVGTHCLDLVEWLMVPSCGAVVDLACALHTDEHGGPHDESSVISLRFASGATATIVCNMNYTSSRLLEISGSKGAVVCVDTLGPRGTGAISFNRQILLFTPVDPYEAELADFVAAASDATGGTRPRVDVAIGLRNVVLLERAAAAAVGAVSVKKENS
jgi:predicted dehydrogenase